MKYKYAAFLTQEMYDLGFGRTIGIPSIADAQSGFWINRDYEFTRGEDCLIWIMPSSITYVEKHFDGTDRI